MCWIWSPPEDTAGLFRKGEITNKETDSDMKGTFLDTEKGALSVLMRMIHTKTMCIPHER